jgi:Spy/CpxP family protein refolding chaperone
MASPFDSATEKKNIDEYIVLLRENLSQQRDEITGAMLQLTRDQSEKFWPIYDDYEKALGKLKDSRIQNLKTYASGYGQMTDEQLDRVIKEELNLRKQRDELMNRFYEQIKQSLGAETAARFLLVESQVELISDLQLDSTLPVGE